MANIIRQLSIKWKLLLYQAWCDLWILPSTFQAVVLNWFFSMKTSKWNGLYIQLEMQHWRFGTWVKCYSGDKMNAVQLRPDNGEVETWQWWDARVLIRPQQMTHSWVLSLWCLIGFTEWKAPTPNTTDLGIWVTYLSIPGPPAHLRAAQWSTVISLCEVVSTLSFWLWGSFHTPGASSYSPLLAT